MNDDHSQFLAQENLQVHEVVRLDICEERAGESTLNAMNTTSILYEEIREKQQKEDFLMDLRTWIEIGIQVMRVSS